ncbi:MAG: hypothetical protein OJF49_000151 [Ktedonobacterales bacterium]|jgi:plastocyanin|nr:MAG: hypothetical protein OJF49_000151 [Ktedonobacterales bacterium]
MKKMALLTVPLALVFALAVMGCGKTPGTSTTSGPSAPANTIQMDATNFTAKTITVTANTPVHFDDTVAGGGYHIVCVADGTAYSATCLTSGDAPAELLGQGTTFQGGETKDITFTKPGTYNVVCTVHPGMQIIVTVQ